MKKYLFVTDLDSTLLYKGVLSETSKNFIKEFAKRDDIIFCIATGRVWKSSKEYYEALELKTPIICCGGGSIENPHDPAFPSIYYCVQLKLLLNLFNNPNLAENFNTATLTTQYKSYTVNSYEDLKKLVEQKVEEKQEALLYFRIHYLNDNNHAEKIHLLRKTFPDLELYSWANKGTSSLYVEMSSGITNKNRAIKIIANYYNIKPEHIYVFGDNVNDIVMLKENLNSYAMRNADMQIWRWAKNVTDKPCYEDGVVHEIKKIISNLNF